MPKIEYIEDAVEERVDDIKGRYDIRYKRGTVRDVSEGTAEFWISRNKAVRVENDGRKVQSITHAIEPIEQTDPNKAAIAPKAPVVNFDPSMDKKPVIEGFAPPAPPAPVTPPTPGEVKRGPGRPPRA